MGDARRRANAVARLKRDGSVREDHLPPAFDDIIVLVKVTVLRGSRAVGVDAFAGSRGQAVDHEVGGPRSSVEHKSAETHDALAAVKAREGRSHLGFIELYDLVHGQDGSKRRRAKREIHASRRRRED
jgi:hypothetical protein